MAVAPLAFSSLCFQRASISLGMQYVLVLLLLLQECSRSAAYCLVSPSRGSVFPTTRARCHPKKGFLRPFVAAFTPTYDATCGKAATSTAAAAAAAAHGTVGDVPLWPEGRLRVSHIHAVAERAKCQEEEEQQQPQGQPQRRKVEKLLLARVCVCGWVASLREGAGGELLFLDVSDGSSAQPLQCVVAADAAAETAFECMSEDGKGSAFVKGRRLRRGDSLCLRGDIYLVRGRSHTAELRVLPNDSANVKSTCFDTAISPPVQTWGLYACERRRGCGGAPVEAPKRSAEAVTAAFGDAKRYPLPVRGASFDFLRNKGICLRSRHSEFAAISRIRAETEKYLLSFLDSLGFLQVRTPILTGLDCEGAGETFSVSAPRDGNKSSGEGRLLLGKPMFLSVSGQLPLEALAWGLGDVYALSPAFRAENSNTQRHLCEFWMLEAEASFISRQELLNLAERLVRHTLTHVLNACTPDLNILAAHQGNTGKKVQHTAGHLDVIRSVASEPFEIISYAEALRRLKEEGLSPVWGDDLGADEEKLLLQHTARSSKSGHGRGLIIVDHPRSLKPFYMRVNHYGEEAPNGESGGNSNTVASMDVLLPNVGEVLGGSMREERIHVLDESMRQKGLSPDSYSFYRELRLFGSSPRGGFGLGIERLLLFLTGLSNVRDLIPFPRAPRYAPL
ncbi:uncharacterized protein LOC34618505 [Cyclospora cayetanensis]|uniref:Uncharacterized protein LOC34618505 n=1 Tax=Cyclospora cayetanensis TaxID=88456 RepID=A0A6P6RXB6_9EIME|nr:uncharacterized protein LOC34618505 [Cyclospora cayetanensis]